MAELPGLPEEVPQEYRDQLIKFQNQIKILLKNHQILVCRSQKNPQDQQIQKQIEEVKNFLFSFSEQQRIVLDKVRLFLREAEEHRKRQEISDSLDQNQTSSLKQDQKSPNCSTPVKSSKSKTKKKTKVKSKHSNSHTPDSSDDECNEVYLAYFDAQGYKGHVEEYDVSLLEEERKEDAKLENISAVPVLCRVQETFDLVNKENYMLNIDLLTDVNYQMLLSHLEGKKKMRSLKRVITYIPEVSDKKYRYQTFLQNSITSPPHLRRRKPNQLPSNPKPAKSLSEKMETRNKSPNLAKSQVDGAADLSEEDDSGETEEEEPCHTENKLRERIELRNCLRKRKNEMELEIEGLEKKRKYLQDVREAQKETKQLLMTEQRETRAKIEQLHLLAAKFCQSPNIL